MPTALSHEFRLAAACSIWPHSDDRNEAIHEAAAGPLDWHCFLRVVMRHRVVGLVHDGLTRVRLVIPPEIAHVLRGQAAALVRQNLALAAEAVRLQRLFADAELPVIFVKGIPLAKLAYGNLGLRHGKDLDLLVSPELFPAATALVEHAGYQRFDPPVAISKTQLNQLLPLRKDFGYVHKETGFEIELHWRLLPNPHFMNETSVMSSSQVVPLEGTIGLRTLGEDDLFTYLCAHGALHWWHQLKWLADVGSLLARTSSDGVERLYRAAEGRGVGRAAAQAILLCQRLLGTNVPDQLITKFRESATVRWLETTALNAMTSGNSEVEPREILFGTTRGSLSCFLLRRNWRYWLAELKIQLICQTDILTISLPKRLLFLYPLLRAPLWLWRHSMHRISALQ